MAGTKSTHSTHPGGGLEAALDEEANPLRGLQEEVGGIGGHLHGCLLVAGAVRSGGEGRDTGRPVAVVALEVQ